MGAKPRRGPRPSDLRGEGVCPAPSRGGVHVTSTRAFPRVGSLRENGQPSTFSHNSSLSPQRVILNRFINLNHAQLKLSSDVRFFVCFRIPLKWARHDFYRASSPPQGVRPKTTAVTIPSSRDTRAGTGTCKGPANRRPGSISKVSRLYQPRFSENNVRSLIGLVFL